ncbi:MAG: beta-galactosidase trimerization domain-containing protein, partial [Gorillibacterium sp.]|nr:beta-galactosidase trimerization domain-containing protein [Gorillibacterium sp.]
IANGARCSIGDQLHPSGLMDPATYRLIGAAYAEVEAKEAWCADAQNVADIGLLSLEAVQQVRGSGDTRDVSGKIDAGAARILLEGKYLFDVIDMDADFGRYKVLILPDDVRVTPVLMEKINAYLSTGGKLLATGRSGMNEAGDAFKLDLGVAWESVNPYQPDYFKPLFPLRNLGDASFIFYAEGQKVRLVGGKELGKRENSYFNRDTFTFCSHQHTPDSHEYGGPGMVESDAGIYLAWNVFEDYSTKGSLVLKETVCYALDRLLPSKLLQTDLPAQGIVTVQQQPGESRYINHLLYASPVKRGDGIEVIEDILPVYNVQVTLRLPSPARKVYLAPQMLELPYDQTDGELSYTVPKLECHQMIVVEV